jgi:hypothetical protein
MGREHREVLNPFASENVALPLKQNLIKRGSGVPTLEFPP